MSVDGIPEQRRTVVLSRGRPQLPSTLSDNNTFIWSLSLNWKRSHLRSVWTGPHSIGTFFKTNLEDTNPFCTATNTPFASAWSYKARVDSFLTCVILKFPSSATPADCIEVSMAIYRSCVHKHWWGFDPMTLHSAAQTLTFYSPRSSWFHPSPTRGHWWGWRTLARLEDTSLAGLEDAEWVGGHLWGWRMLAGLEDAGRDGGCRQDWRTLTGLEDTDRVEERALTLTFHSPHSSWFRPSPRRGRWLDWRTRSCTWSLVPVLRVASSVWWWSTETSGELKEILNRQI